MSHILDSIELIPFIDEAKKFNVKNVDNVGKIISDNKQVKYWHINFIFSDRMSTFKTIDEAIKAYPFLEQYINQEKVTKVYSYGLVIYPEPSGCKFNGLTQKYGTCWYNSIINGFLFGKYGRTYLKDKVLSYKQNTNVQLFKQQVVNLACYKDISLIHFYQIISKLLCNEKVDIKSDNIDISRALIVSSGMNFTHLGLEGWWSLPALEKFLKNTLSVKYTVFNTREAFVTNFDKVDGDVEIIIVKTSANNHLNLPDEVSTGKKRYCLDHVNIFVEFSKSKHFLSGGFYNDKRILCDSARSTNITTTQVFNWNEPCKVIQNNMSKTIYSAEITKVDVLFAVYILIESKSKNTNSEDICLSNVNVKTDVVDTENSSYTPNSLSNAINFSEIGFQFKSYDHTTLKYTYTHLYEKDIEFYLQIEYNTIILILPLQFSKFREAFNGREIEDIYFDSKWIDKAKEIILRRYKSQTIQIRQYDIQIANEIELLFDFINTTIRNTRSGITNAMYSKYKRFEYVIDKGIEKSKLSIYKVNHEKKKIGLLAEIPFTYSNRTKQPTFEHINIYIDRTATGLIKLSSTNLKDAKNDDVRTIISLVSQLAPLKFTELYVKSGGKKKNKTRTRNPFHKTDKQYKDSSGKNRVVYTTTKPGGNKYYVKKLSKTTGKYVYRLVKLA